MQSSSQQNDHTFMLLFLGMITMVLLVSWLTRQQLLLLSVWQIIYLPLSKLIAWFSTIRLGQGINWLLGHSQKQALDLPLYMQQTPLNQYTWAFCAQASGFINSYLLILFIPPASYLIYRLHERTTANNYHANAKAFYKFTQPHTLPTLPDALAPRAFAKQHRLYMLNRKTIIGVKTTKIFPCLAMQLGRRFTNMEEFIDFNY